jgi:membrane glycosyltransferase
MAGWAGAAANFYGHNALIRVRAFAEAAGLPRLSGKAPFGGDLLSHDFVEAAWLRRAGWAVEFDPDSRGSAEGGPQTLSVYHKRDRRWCQGNLQHLRLLGARGLHPASRLHFLGGVAGYVSAPIWLALILLSILAGPGEGMVLPALAVFGLILATKVFGVAGWLSRRNTPWSRAVVLRAALRELAVSTLIAPAMMMRHSVAVLSVAAGQDCGWKPAGGAARSGDNAWLEPMAGAALLIAAVPGGDDLWQFALVAPIAVPLLLAPLIGAWLDRAEGAPLLPRPVVARLVPARYAVQR